MNFFSVLTRFEALATMSYLQASEETTSVLPNKRSSYRNSVIESMKNPTERIKQYHKERYTISIIDGVVKMKTLNESIRKEHLDFWESRKLEMCVFIALGVPMVAIPTYTFVKEGGKQIQPILSVASGIVGLATIVFGCYRLSQCEKQAAYWRLDLPTTVASQRKDALKKGLIFLIEQDHLKNEIQPSYASIISPNELRGLYFDYLCTIAKKFENCIDTKQQLSNLTKIKSPLSLDVIQYAQLDSDDIEKLKVYIDRYEELTHEFASIKKETVRLKEQVKNVFDQKIGKKYKEKYKDLLIIDLMYNQNKKKIEEKKVQALSNCRSIEEQIEICKKCDEELAKIKTSWIVSKETSAIFFGGDCKNIQMKRDRVLAKIDESQNAKLLSFYNEMKLLHNNAYRTLIGKSLLSVFHSLVDR